MRLAAVSVDLDEIPNYYAIHGLEPSVRAATLVYDRALGRLDRFAGAHGFPLTLFAIGQDLERLEAAARLKELEARGAEIANHSFSHRYDFSRLDSREMRREIELGASAIERAVGRRPTGFRAPGYTVNDAVFAALADCGVTYDSSVFPCPAYYGAKALAIGAIALRGRESRSVVDDPRVLFAPTRPYRIGSSYRTRGEGMLEMPIQVTRGVRLPFIGTSITLARAAGAKLLAGMCVGEPFVNLELHGIDLLDRADGLEVLAPHQPDVRVPLAEKEDALGAAVETLKKAGYSFVTLEEAAAAFA